MSLASFVKRTIWSVTPLVTRPNGGVFLTHLPTGAGTKTAAAKALTAHATAANQYGGVAAVITATANTTECWVEGVVIANPSAAKKQYHVLVTTATAIVTGAAGLPNVFAEVVTEPGLTTDCHYVAVPQRVYIPAGVAINLALACSTAAATCDAYLVISRNK